MVVALEAHLQGCSACAGDVAALRQTWAALDTLPQVEPPPDFARRVAARVVEEQWARRQSRPDLGALWRGWLRSLTPVHGIGAAAIAALLALGIAVPLWLPERTTQLNPLPRLPDRPMVTAPQDHPPVELDPTLVPGVTARAPRWENGRWVGVVEVIPERDLQGATVRAMAMSRIDNRRLAGAGAVDLARGTMRAGRSYVLPIPMDGSALGARVVMISLVSPALSEQYRKVVAFPVPVEATSGSISLEFRAEDIYLALARLAAATRRPIVADAGLTDRVTARVASASPEQALNAVLAPLGYRWQSSGEGYLVTRY
jgi:hypothetical protein